MAKRLLKENDEATDLIIRSLYQETELPASEKANDPRQCRFVFFDDSYPVLDNLYRPVPEDEEIWLSFEDSLLLTTMSFILRQRLEKVLSPQTRDGYRIVLPFPTLQKRRVLEGMRVLDVSAEDDLHAQLVSLGADATLISPSGEAIDGPSWDTQGDKTKVDTFGKMAKKIAELTSTGDAYDLIVVERYNLFNALAGEEPYPCSFEFPTTESLVSAVCQENYPPLISIGDGSTPYQNTESQIFSSKVLKHAIRSRQLLDDYPNFPAITKQISCL